MNTVSLRFYGELNELLKKEDREHEIRLCLGEQSSVKDVIESRGVPHTEVYYILINKSVRDFACNIQDGDKIEAFPYDSG